MYCDNTERANRLRVIGKTEAASEVQNPHALNASQVYWRSIYGAHLKQLRKQMGLNQEAFGSYVGFSGNCICDLETGKRAASIDTICQIAEKTGVSPAWFFVDDPESPFWADDVDPRKTDPIHAPWNYHEKFKSVFGKIQIPKK
ncbi:MAG: helix-turn-helix domain-containing protein [Coriobacteriales bacterium]